MAGLNQNRELFKLYFKLLYVKITDVDFQKNKSI